MDFKSLIPDSSAETPTETAPSAVEVVNQLGGQGSETAPATPETPQQQTPNTPAPAETSAAAPAPATTAEVDYKTYLDKMSDGFITDEDGFKAVLPKIKEYDTLKAQNDELTAKMAQAPVFANDEVRILNELVSKGATKEQIKTFHKLNDLGTITEMPYKDAIIADLIMKGTKESTALFKVERDFKLDDDSLDERERELLDDDLRVAGEEARANLAGLKAKAADPLQIAPEESQLQLQARTIAHKAAVKPYVGEIVTSLPHLGEFVLSPAKENAAAVKFELPIDANAKQQIGEFVEAYFMDGLVPVTQETTREAMDYARAEYFRTNSEKVFQMVFDRAESLTTERLVNKYENRSGLRSPGDNPVQQTNAEAETAAWMAKKVNRV